MLKGIVLLCFFVFALQLHAQQKKDSLVTQTIVYKTKQAGEMYLLWAMNNWKIPEEKYWPAGTFIKEGVAYTKMNAIKDSFFVDLKLPKGIYIDFMFWVSKNNKGEDADGWDTYWGQNYNYFISPKPKIKIVNDEKLAFVVKEKKRTFSILEEGKNILYISLIVLIIVLIVQFFRMKTTKPLAFSSNTFIAGFLATSFLLMMLVRLQMNDYIFTKQYLVFGVSFYDLMLLCGFSLIIFILLLVTKKYRMLQNVIKVISVILITGFLLFSILNIEIVKQLGKPLSYNWLYYSDFLKATDAKNALRKNFYPGFITNLLLIIFSVAIMAYAIALFTYKSHYLKLTAIILCTLPLLFLIASYYEVKKYKFESAKIENPVYVLVASWINAESKPSLFTIKVSQQTKTDIVLMHQQQLYEKLPGTDSITNVVMFIMESTPANMVQVFDSTYQVTPNLNEWKKYAAVYTNMYAHLPNTVNSIFSITSSLYPMISYKAIINEHPNINTATLPQLLKDNGWNTSLFYSSDLSYSNIGGYATHHGFETAEDFKIIRCDFKKFESNYAQLDGLDDRCIVSGYLNWKDSLKEQKTFSMLWVNQTHYPYFSHDKNKYTNNAELNPYLNALKNVDEAFSQLMQGLKSRNNLNNTLVVVVGDHGEAFGTHNQYSHASKVYEENLHVPCLLINPVLFNGEKNNRIAGLIDIAPTVMHLLNIKTPQEWEGMSLLDNRQKNHTFFVGPFSDFLFGSRFDNWKLIYNATINEYELYDLNKDPKELTNVANQHPDILKKEYEILSGWVQFHTAKIDSVVSVSK